MANKRSHNEGSIYRRPNGNWRAQVTLQGKRLSYNGRTKADCQAWIRKTLEQMDNAKITLDGFLTDWLTSVENNLRANTFKQYKQIVRNHIVPELGSIKMRDLMREHIQKRYNDMIAIGKGLRTIQLTHAVLHRALVQPIQLGIIPRNPDDVTIPHKPKQKEMKFLDQSQVHSLLISAKQMDRHYYALYYLAIATGLRQAELLALKWLDLDGENLEVKRQLTWKKEGSFEFTQPKTKAGKRKISLGLQTIQVLEEHRQLQADMKNQAHVN